MKKRLFMIAVVAYVLCLFFSPMLYNFYMNILVAEYNWKPMTIMVFNLALTRFFSPSVMLMLDEEGVDDEYKNI